MGSKSLELGRLDLMGMGQQGNMVGRCVRSFKSLPTDLVHQPRPLELQKHFFWSGSKRVSLNFVHRMPTVLGNR